MQLRLIAFPVAFLLAAVASAATLPLSYPAARDRLRGVSAAVEAAGAEVDRASAASDASRYLGYPKVSLGAQYISYSKEVSADLGPLLSDSSINIPPPIASTIPRSVTLEFGETGPRLNATITWPLYTGGRITAAQSALASGVEIARAEANEVVEQQARTLIERYFGLSLAQRARALREEVVAGIADHLDAARKFEAQGMISKIERLHAQVAYDEALRNLARARQDEAIASGALARLLRSPDAIAPQTPLFVTTGGLQPLTSFLAVLDAHPTLAVLDGRRAQAGAMSAAERARWLPEVFAFGHYEFVRRYLAPTDPDWILGVGVSYALFDSVDRSRSIAAAQAAERRVDALRREAETGLATLIEKHWRAADAAAQRFGLLASGIELARETLRLREAAFREGQGTSLEVVDARLALGRAEIDRVQTAYEFVDALSALLTASGQIERFDDYLLHADVRLAP